MGINRRSSIALIALMISLVMAGCDTQPATQTNANTNTNSNTSPAARTASQPASNAAVTLPVLDAFLADPSFAADLKSRVQLSDEEVEKLRTVAREATSGLRESDDDQQYTGTTPAAVARANEQIESVIGREKAQQLLSFVNERWGGAGTPGLPATPGAVPTDSRIVVNAPAFRMDVFNNGQLVKTYKIGIGYPEFPLPTGLRSADTIIFNPTWTPPDEPWVEKPGSKVKVGKTVEAGSKLNPLGIAKIPIGLPSLIHGGKAPAKLGSFASHGCVGLTNDQLEEFTKDLAQIGGVTLTDAEIAAFQKDKTETKNVKLSTTVPVELRYETIVVSDGKLHIYRDVYDRNTNTEESLRAVLGAYGVTLEQLSDGERAQVMEALNKMSRDVTSNPSQPSPNEAANKNQPANKNGAKPANNSNGRVTQTIKGEKEIAIEIAALRGKGYPAPAGNPAPGNQNADTRRKA